MRRIEQMLAGACDTESGELADAVEELTAYYESDDWKADFEADEAGLLPKDLPRGVLSEDGVYNLLEVYRHKTLEERADSYGGELEIDTGYDWDKPVGREIW